MPPSVERSAAENLVDELKLDGVFPVPLEAIAKHLGYEAVEFDPSVSSHLTEVAGVVNHQEKKILLNKNDSTLRKRFTLAHEIGHVVLHAGHSIVDFRKNIEQPSTQKEQEANQYAADLLMPALPFIKQWLSTPFNYDALSKRFGVSKDAAEVRARSLRLDRA